MPSKSRLTANTSAPTASTAATEQLAQKLKDKTGLKMNGFPISPVIGAHLGPDAVGVGWVEELM